MDAETLSTIRQRLNQKAMEDNAARWRPAAFGALGDWARDVAARIAAVFQARTEQGAQADPAAPSNDAEVILMPSSLDAGPARLAAPQTLRLPGPQHGRPTGSDRLSHGEIAALVPTGVRVAAAQPPALVGETSHARARVFDAAVAGARRACAAGFAERLDDRPTRIRLALIFMLAGAATLAAAALTAT